MAEKPARRRPETRGRDGSYEQCVPDPTPEQLFELVYQELRQLARGYLARERAGHTLQPTALVHEAWMRVNRQTGVDWKGRTHMLAIGAQAMRRLLIDHGRNRKRVKRGGGQKPETLHD